MSSKHTAVPLVRLRGVDVALGGATVLRDIDWCLEPGTHWGIVGANGSGKTTLLGLIAGSVWPAPDRGTREYCFDGKRWPDAVEARRRIATVGPELQDRYTRWGWNFTAIEVVLSGVFRTDVPRRRPSAEERGLAMRLLADCALETLADRPFLELSRGQQRRVLIARAMAFEPALLVLDEPASGLDARARGALESTLERAAATMQIVASAHREADLPRVVREVLVLEAGRVTKQRARSQRGAGAPTSRARGRRLERRRDEDRCALVKVEHADVWLSGRRVLNDLCWVLAPGEHWLVKGPNGAGKSTFLKLLHGQLRPALGGSITWPALGHPRDVWALRRQVGFMSPEFQASYLYPTSVRDCIASGFDSSVGLTRRLAPAESARVEALLDRFALRELESRRLTALSYGQRRRALLARAFAHQPRVLLLDEPWAGLDAATTELVGTQLAASMHDGTQLVCVTHLDEAPGFTHELEIDDGRIVHAMPVLSRDDADGARRENSPSARRRAAD